MLLILIIPFVWTPFHNYKLWRWQLSSFVGTVIFILIVASLLRGQIHARGFFFSSLIFFSFFSFFFVFVFKTIHCKYNMGDEVSKMSKLWQEVIINTVYIHIYPWRWQIDSCLTIHDTVRLWYINTRIQERREEKVHLRRSHFSRFSLSRIDTTSFVRYITYFIDPQRHPFSRDHLNNVRSIIIIVVSDTAKQRVFCKTIYYIVPANCRGQL